MRLISVLGVLLLLFHASVNWWGLEEIGPDKCHPCHCETKGTTYGYDHGAEYEWRYGRKFHRIVCNFNGYTWETTQIPWQAGSNTKLISIMQQSICQHGPLRTSWFKKFWQLRVIHCTECNCRSLELDLLYPHRNTMKEILIRWNPIREIPVGFHQNAPLLEIAGYDGSQIQIIYAGTFANLSEFKWANLPYNNIHTIEIGAFKNIPKFKWMNLRDNKLEFVAEWAFDNYNFVGYGRTNFANNRFFCNDELCPFMNRVQNSSTARCSEPKKFSGKEFRHALAGIGTQALQVRHQVDIEDSVIMSCVTCGNVKLQFQKGTEDIGTGTLPSGCTIKYNPNTYVTELVIAKALEEHNGNYSCFRSDCITPDCPIPIISLTVNMWEPVWNFSKNEGRIDEIVRHGISGYFFGLIPLLIYSILMATCMSGYFIYQQIKKNRQPPQQEPQQQEA